MLQEALCGVAGKLGAFTLGFLECWKPESFYWVDSTVYQYIYLYSSIFSIVSIGQRPTANPWREELLKDLVCFLVKHILLIGFAFARIFESSSLVLIKSFLIFGPRFSHAWSFEPEHNPKKPGILELLSADAFAAWVSRVKPGWKGPQRTSRTTENILRPPISGDPGGWGLNLWMFETARNVFSKTRNTFRAILILFELHSHSLAPILRNLKETMT